MLLARDLRFAYARDGFTLNVPELAINGGETVGLGGPSGTGKTTLLKLLCGILSPHAGALSFNGQDMLSLSPSARRAMRLSQCGLVFQDFALLDYLTVEQNVMLPLRLSTRLQTEHASHARKMAEQLDIERHWQRLTSELSQGERQRVAIVRALAHAPKLVLADEPTASLDSKRKRLALDLLVNYAKTTGAALVMVTHDVELFARLDRVTNVEDWTA